MPKCKVCKVAFTRTRPLQSVCSPICAIELAKSKREKSERALYKVKKESLKTRSDYMKEAQAALNAWIRYRDRDQGCISCEKPATWTGQWHAGHYLSRGSHPNLAVGPIGSSAEDNVHRQCSQCNHFNPAGTARRYREKLIDRIGLDRVEALECDNAPRKWAIQDLIEIRDSFRLRLRQAKKTQVV